MTGWRRRNSLTVPGPCHGAILPQRSFSKKFNDIFKLSTDAFFCRTNAPADFAIWNYFHCIIATVLMTCYFHQRRDRQTKLTKYSNLDECHGTSYGELIVEAGLRLSIMTPKMFRKMWKLKNLHIGFNMWWQCGALGREVYYYSLYSLKLKYYSCIAHRPRYEKGDTLIYSTNIIAFHTCDTG